MAERPIKGVLTKYFTIEILVLNLSGPCRYVLPSAHCKAHALCIHSLINPDKATPRVTGHHQSAAHMHV